MAALLRWLCSLSILIIARLGKGSSQWASVQSSYRSTRRLAQAAVSNAIIPVFQDQSPCATMNAQDAAPLFDKDNVILGWVTLKRGSVNVSGITTLQLDLTSHLSDMYLAAAREAANVRACITTEAPSACPEASTFMYHKELAADCSRRRATLEITVPPDIFNCSYQSVDEHAVMLYVQVSADLAPEACSPASGTFFAGSQRSAISPGCSYITVRATCTPDTCEVPIADLAAVEAQAAKVEEHHKKNMVGVIVGVSVGTAVLILSILAGIAYLHKRDREEAERRKLHLKHSDGSDGGNEFFSSTSVSSDDDTDFNISGKSTTVLGMGGGAGTPWGGARGSILSMGRRASALFNRTPHNIDIAKPTSTPPAVDSSVAFAGYIPAVVGAWAQHPGEVLRLQGVKRFSDKYVNSSVQHSGYSRGAFGVGQDIMYGNPTFNSPQSFLVGSSGPSAVSVVQDTIPAGLYDSSPRADTATPAWAPSPSRHPGIGAGGGHVSGQPVSPTAKSSVSPMLAAPPPPVVPVTLGGRRSSALLLAELGFGPSVTSPRVAKAAAGGSGADLHDPEVVPENFCAFINPLAVMGGRIDSMTTGTVRRVSALQPCKPMASPAGGAAVAAAAAAASTFRRAAGVTTSGSTSSLSFAQRLPSPPQKARQRRSGQWADSDVEDEGELISSPVRRRRGSVASLASMGGGGRAPPAQPGRAAATAASAAPAPAGSTLLPVAVGGGGVSDERAAAAACVTTPTGISGGPSSRPMHWTQSPELSFKLIAEMVPIGAEEEEAAPAAAHVEGPEPEQQASRGSAGSIVLGQPVSPSLPRSPRAWRGGGGNA